MVEIRLFRRFIWKMSASIVAMAKKRDLDFISIGLGLALAVAFVFVAAAIVLFTDFFFDLKYSNFALREPKPTQEEAILLGAWATLVGNMIGAVGSGVLAVLAAFGAVYLEGAERRNAKRLRQQAITASLYLWEDYKLGFCYSLFGRIEDWATVQIRSANTFEVPMTKLAECKLLPKNRELAEKEFPSLVVIFGAIDEYDTYFASKSKSILAEINSEIGDSRNKREAEFILSGILCATDRLLALMAQIADQVSDDKIGAAIVTMRAHGQSSRQKMQLGLLQLHNEQLAAQKAAQAANPNKLEPDELDQDTPPMAAEPPPDKSTT